MSKENLGKIFEEELMKSTLFYYELFSISEEQKLWSEDKLQGEFWKWTWNEYQLTRRLLFHIPNERRIKHVAEIVRLKSIGMIPGALDMQFYWREKVYWFEFKIQYKYMSEEQVKFAEVQIINGAKVFVIRRLEQGKAIFKKILGD